MRSNRIVIPITGESSFSQKHTPSILAAGNDSTITYLTPDSIMIRGTLRTPSADINRAFNLGSAAASVACEYFGAGRSMASCRTRYNHAICAGVTFAATLVFFAACGRVSISSIEGTPKNLHSADSNSVSLMSVTPLSHPLLIISDTGSSNWSQHY